MERVNDITLSEDLVDSFSRDIKYTELNYNGPDNGIINPIDVIKAHFVVVDFCTSDSAIADLGGVGGIGVKDYGLLFSAVDRQYASYGGREKWPDADHKLASVIFGIVKNHAFHDANKRTALLSLILSLYRQGRLIECEKSEIEDIIVYMAADELHLFDEYENYEEDNDSAVNFFAEYIRRKTRKIDNRIYIITFRELSRRLRNHGFDLVNPDRNYIDVVSIETGRRVYKAGFPGWSRQVVKGDMRKILDACDLTPAKGIDARVFFEDTDPSFAFASDYRSQLASLAIR